MLSESRLNSPNYSLPYLGPRWGGVPNEGIETEVEIQAYPENAQELVLIIPVKHDIISKKFHQTAASEKIPKHQVNSSKVGWQAFPITEGSNDTTGYLVFSLRDWISSRTFSNLTAPINREEAQNLIDLQHSGLLEKTYLKIPSSLSPSSNRHASQTMSGLRLAFSSCQYPAGILDSVPAYESINRLNALAKGDRGLDGVLLLGDQIYADASYGILDPKVKSDRIERSYDDWLRIPAIRSLMQLTPVFTMIDDHEYHDNWDLMSDPSDYALGQALSAFERHQRWAPRYTPPSAPGEAVKMAAKSSGDPFLYSQEIPQRPQYWQIVNMGEWEVFMLDTRTERQGRPWGPQASDGTPAHILGEAQRRAMEVWLEEAMRQNLQREARPKIIASPNWVLPRLAESDGAVAGLSDGWDGFPASLKWFLGIIINKQIDGVLLLCGDAHLAGHSEITLTKNGAKEMRLHILHSPALYAPFPFANGHPHQYKTRDSFYWTDSGSNINCTVTSDLRELGDGFVVIKATQEGGSWVVKSEFNTNKNADQPSWELSIQYP